MPGLQRRLARRHERLEAVGGVAHHAALADPVTAELELRLHEREQVERSAPRTPPRRAAPWPGR